MDNNYFTIPYPDVWDSTNKLTVNGSSHLPNGIPGLFEGHEYSVRIQIQDGTRQTFSKPCTFKCFVT
jgi:hypothetical protein